VTSPESPRRGVVGPLLGRSAELSLIHGYLARARNEGDALLVLGDPGVGKTMLLDVAAEAASRAGGRVLRARGVEFEAGMSFSGLNQTLLPVFGEFGRLNAANRDALNVALGLGEGRPPDRLVVSNATLALLRLAATERPMLVVVDDVPWLDRASAAVLGFVARRLAGSRVGFLAAARPEQASFFDRAGLPELEVQPLDAEAAGALVGSRFPGLACTVRERVLAEAQGNPLALLELPAALSEAQRAALEELPPTLPLSRRLQALFASRIEEMPVSTRQLLLLMALDGTGDLRVLEQSVVTGSGLGDLAAAERAGLAHVDPGTHRPAFRHPLIRSAVVELATGDERRRAHRQLAELRADQPDRRAWHLAEATVEPDEGAAELVERAAYRTLGRGDGAGAVAALTRAADLSPQGVDRGRRLAEAAYIGARVTGELRNATQLLADAHRADPQFKDSLQAAVTAAFVLINGDGDVETSHRLLVGAIESAHDTENAALEQALHTLRLVCFYGGRAELWGPFYDALTRLGPDVPPGLDLATKTSADPARTAAAAVPQLERAISQLATEADPTVIMRVAFAAGFVDRRSECRQAVLRVARAGRETGAVGSLIQGLILLAFDDFWTGQWDEARRLADEAVELCETLGFPLFALSVRNVLAAVAAARGDYADANAALDAMIQWAMPRGVGVVHHISCHVRGLAALGRGEFEEAYRLASAISPPGTLASHVPLALWVMLDVVEAAVHTGRHVEADAHVAALHHADVAAISSRTALLAGAATAVAAADDHAAQLFEHALAIPGASHWPFDLARVQLVYGERLRRLRATTESRVHLGAALETFERLGARPWATRARNELRATGQTKPRAGEHAWASLTPQEREIAMLAAAGLTNKQIAERLFLSHRTVGGHLHRLFPKLGVATRAALRDALASLPGGQQERTRS
jgi:DNA-binding CsgD family transcriptional regulator